MAFNPGQKRDRLGMWTSGGVARRVATERAENIPGRSSKTAGQRAREVRANVKRVDALRGRALAGERLPLHDAGLVEYQSPKLRAAARARQGNVVRTRGEALSMARDRRAPGLARREVSVNPFTGRNVARGGRRSLDYIADPAALSSGQGGRNITRASVARKKAATPARGRLSKPEYVGRRRAEP